MLPEPLPDTLPSDPHAELRDISALTNAEALLSHLDCTLAGKCGEALAGTEGLIQELDDGITGYMERFPVQHEQLLAKLDDKFDKQLQLPLLEAYSHMTGLGIPFPSDEEVMYHSMYGQLPPADMMLERTVAHPEPPKGPPPEPIPQPPPGGDIPKSSIDFPPVPPRQPPPTGGPIGPLPGPPPQPVPPVPPPKPIPPGFGAPIPPQPPPRMPLPWPPWIPFPVPMPPFGGPVPMPPLGPVPPLGPYPFPPAQPVPPIGGPIPIPSPFPQPFPPPPGPTPVPPPPYGGPIPSPMPPGQPVPPTAPVPPGVPIPMPPGQPVPPGGPVGPCDFLSTPVAALTGPDATIDTVVRTVIQKYIWPIVSGWCGPIRIQLDPTSCLSICSPPEPSPLPPAEPPEEPEPPEPPEPPILTGAGGDTILVYKGPRTFDKPADMPPFFLWFVCRSGKWERGEVATWADKPRSLLETEVDVGWFDTAEEAAELRDTLASDPAELERIIGLCGGTKNQPKVTPTEFKSPDWSKLDWDDPAVCDQLKELEGLLESPDPMILSKLLGLRYADGSRRKPAWLEKIIGLLPPSLQGSIANAMAEGVEAAWGFLDKLPEVNGCKKRTNAIPVIIRGLLSAIQRWTGFDTSDIAVPYDLWYQWSCPFEIPSGPDVHALWSRKVITDEQAECLLRANGLLPGWQQLIHFAQRPWPPIDRVWFAKETGGMDEDEFRTMVGRAGYGEGTDLDRWVRTSQYQPTQTDLVTWMTRDVFDEETVDWKEADAEFKKKWAGKALQYGKATNVPDAVMRNNWRAHYRLPSPTQLYEMLHRLRKGRVDDKLVVEKQLLLDTLGQNDVHPAWRDRLAAISFRPLTRVDAQRAFRNGDLDYDGLFQAYLDLGYDHPSAGAMADFARANKERAYANHRVIKLYRKGGLPRSRAEDLLKAEGVPVKVSSRELDFIDLEQKSKSKRACLAALRRRYRSGELREGDIPAAVGLLGYSTEEGVEIQTQWACEKESTDRVASAAKLCEFYQYGLLSPAQMLARLKGLGYDSSLALDLVRLCHKRLTGSDIEERPEVFDSPLPEELQKRPKS